MCVLLSSRRILCFLSHFRRPRYQEGSGYVIGLFVFFVFTWAGWDVTWTYSLFTLLFTRSAIVDPLSCVLGSLPEAKLARSSSRTSGAGLEPGHQLCGPLINIWPGTAGRIDLETGCDSRPDDLTCCWFGSHSFCPVFKPGITFFRPKNLNSILFLARPASRFVRWLRSLPDNAAWCSWTFSNIPEEFRNVALCYCLRWPHEQKVAEVVLEEGGGGTKKSQSRRTAGAQHAQAEKPPDLWPLCVNA